MTTSVGFAILEELSSLIKINYIEV